MDSGKKLCQLLDKPGVIAAPAVYDFKDLIKLNKYKNLID